MKYDVTIVGGGTAGISAAYISAKYGLKTLLIEKSDVLGGLITQGLVIPCMKTDTSDINTEFYHDLKAFADKYRARHTYIDNNDGWFNPELLKVVFDDMLTSVGCDVFFSSYPTGISFRDIFKIDLKHKLLSLYIESNYIIDTTSEGEIFKILNYDFQKKSDKKQMPSLRFIISDINIKKFANYILKLDKNRNVTTAEYTDEQIYLSTACTYDETKNWALYPIFKRAVESGDVTEQDASYFQVFSIPQMHTSLAFNCPRIFPDGDVSDVSVYSKALIQGRQRIIRIYEFCKKYLPGFENSTVSHISDMLGIRESARIKGKYTLTKEDIIWGKKFENPAFTSNYPIDIHSENNNEDKLEFTNHTYSVPIECLISANNEKLYASGKIISAEFEAQAAVRTQLNCFSMGEACAKDIFSKIH